MPSFLEKILKSRKAPMTAEDFRRMQTDAEKEVERALAAGEAAQQAWNDSLLDESDAATKAARARVVDADDAHARAVARVAAIREEFLKACEAEAEADRQGTYERALDLARKAKPAFRRYEKAALEIRAALAEIAAAEVAIDAANSDLPRDAAPVTKLEMDVRGLPGEPRRVVDSRADLLWVYRDWPEMIVEKEKVALIESEDGVRGVFRDPWGRNSTDEIPVIRRRRTFEKIMPGVSAFTPTPLAGAVFLPGIAPGSPPIWAPVGGNPMFDENDPRAVIEAAQALAARGDKGSDPRSRADFPDQFVTWSDIDPNEARELDAALAAAAGSI